MEAHFKFTDEEFELQFLKADLLFEFSHEAHLRLAYIHIKRYGVTNATTNIIEQLQKYVTVKNAESKFNLTLTVAAVKIVQHFISRSPKHSFTELLETYPRLLNNFNKLIKTHYDFDVFQSAKAKAEYLEPDLIPFS